MKEPIKDDERLSAFVDGRVTDPEREELLEHLSTSEDDYEVFTDTVEILSALEEEDARAAAPAEKEPIPFLTRRPRTPVPAYARAAASVGIVLISALALALVLRGRAPSGMDPVELAALVDPRGQGLPEAWTGISRWSGQYRGDGSARDRDVRSVRAGALLAELSVAVRARNIADTQLLAREMSGRFEPGVGGTPLRQIHEHAGAPPDSLADLLDRATDRLATDLDRKALELGAWLGAARLAANRHNDDFFRKGPTHAMLDRAERMARGDADATDALERVRKALPGDGTPQRASLQSDLEDLLHALAS
ncbi:MAG TPA: zf-HC2 domain-containing protein [Longimicrobium sp.]|nr:zf-HC2 domain-containing protein [Longimicrobium sp.]